LGVGWYKRVIFVYLFVGFQVGRVVTRVCVCVERYVAKNLG